MNATQWAEIAAMGFALAVLAWVIYRLTWALVRIYEQSDEPEQAATGGDPGEGD